MNLDSIQDIDIELLRDHPENSNFMNTETMRKLRLHIERTSRYEPLTVRSHPVEVGMFQVINGHNRLRVLRALGHKTINCVVWNINDDQARLYLATLNRLSGKEVPERRAALLGNLCKIFDEEELITLLPDDRKQIEELRRLSKIEPEEIIQRSDNEQEPEIPVILSFVLTKHEANGINLALDLISQRNETLSRGQALLELARNFLK